MNITLFVYVHHIIKLEKNISSENALYVYPAVYKIHSLLQSCNRENLLPLCLFVKKALKRNSQLMNM